MKPFTFFVAVLKVNRITFSIYLQFIPPPFLKKNILQLEIAYLVQLDFLRTFTHVNKNQQMAHE
jgi:hypothetical protein